MINSSRSLALAGVTGRFATLQLVRVGKSSAWFESVWIETFHTFHLVSFSFYRTRVRSLANLVTHSLTHFCLVDLIVVTLVRVSSFLQTSKSKLNKVLDFDQAGYCSLYTTFLRKVRPPLSQAWHFPSPIYFPLPLTKYYILLLRKILKYFPHQFFFLPSLLTKYFASPNIFLPFLFLSSYTPQTNFFLKRKRKIPWRHSMLPAESK